MYELSFKDWRKVSGIEKRIHVDDNGVVEFCVVDSNCPYGSFENVSEAWEHYQKRPKSNREIELPRGFKTVRLSSHVRSGGIYVYKDAIPHEKLFEYAESCGYEIINLSATPRTFIFRNLDDGSKFHTYSNSIKHKGCVNTKKLPDNFKKIVKRKRFKEEADNVVAYFQGHKVIYGDGYLLMEQAFNQAFSNFEQKKDWNWRESFLNESVTLSMAIEHAGSRLQDVRNRDDVDFLRDDNHTVISFLKLCAEIINRTDILSEQTIKIFGSNDDEVIGDLLREAIRH